MVGTVNLAKNATVNLSKGDSSLTEFCVGANWGMMFINPTAEVPSRIEITESKGFFGFGKKEVVTEIPAIPAGPGTPVALDLDLSAAAFDANGSLIKSLDYRNYRNNPINGMVHSGDDTEGDADGIDSGLDNEVISVNLTKINSNVAEIVFFLNTFTRNVDFLVAPHSAIRLYKGTPDNVEAVVANYEISALPEYAGKKGMILGKLSRIGNNWEFKAIGEAVTESSIDDIINVIKRNKY